MQPIPGRVLLVIPEEFERYVYVHSAGNEDVPLPVGEQASIQLRMLMRNAFTTAASLVVGTESEAMEMINGEAPEVLPYDFVALPRFWSVTSWAKPHEYGFDVDLVLELYSIDKAVVRKIRGHGETRTGAHAGSSPRKSADLALTYAVDAVKDSLEINRSTLAR